MLYVRPYNGWRMVSNLGPFLSTLLLLLLLLTPGWGNWTFAFGLRSCHRNCFCAGELMDCSGANQSAFPIKLWPYTRRLDLSYGDIPNSMRNWLPDTKYLLSLKLRHCRLSTLQGMPFQNLKVLTLLDLSSNSLKSIEWHIFTGLDSLEVLLLYNNHLESISGSMRLHKLRSLYLSNNQLQNFPEGLLSPKDRPQTLRVVDLSYNHLQDLPIEKMKDLPLSFCAGLYLHKNPLTCSCALSKLLHKWEQQGLFSTLQFHHWLRCKKEGSDESVHLLEESQEGGFNCSSNSSQCCSSFPPDKSSNRVAYIGDRVVLPCPSRLASHEGTHFSWFTPDSISLETPTFSNHSGTVKVLQNGSLELKFLTKSQAGTYICNTSNELFNLHDSSMVTLKIDKRDNPFSTALTTLIASSAIISLIGLYLFIPPCRRSRPDPVSGPSTVEASQASILSNVASRPQNTLRSETDVPEGGPSSASGPQKPGKRVIILEPHKADKGGHSSRLKEPGEDGREERLLQFLRVKSDSESNCSIYSDTPIVR